MDEIRERILDADHDVIFTRQEVIHPFHQIMPLTEVGHVLANLEGHP
ncbi:MAG: hypothetical protein ETSY2_45470 [Candidatus Entotheonella gemina]|uniref:Uncharacterized protein n=1 Tax=Candidatus Entotheonella gemina TaxID=1429439 RepID=W4LI18_9BACT|nr:MAG: hypothetical protein ETSY2_45470 [Candidatus Entotheonella gemina]